MDFLIREATAVDSVAIAPLFDDYRRFHGVDSDAEASSEFLAERLCKHESRILIAEGSGGEVLAFAQLYPRFASLALRRDWVLADLFVLPEYRRQGIGRALVEASIEFARNESASKLVVSTTADNVAAEQLYLSAGFERVEDVKLFVLGFG